MKKVELKILIGISASGKSTWCKEFVAKNDKWCIVSRDDLRYAWQNKGVVDNKLETIINKIVDSQIETLLTAGYNVLYDATNLKVRYINAIAKIARHTATVTYQIFDVPLETALDRDSKRVRAVGPEVIEKQFKEYLVLLDSFDFKPIAPQPKKYIAPKFDKNKRLAILVDIDGTIAHTSEKRSPFDYTKVQVDECDVVIKRILLQLKSGIVSHEIVFVSGREDSCKSDTIQWLESHKIPFDKLIMRKTGDMRNDAIIKEEIYWDDIEPNYNVVCVFDDRDRVVQMWRNLGLKCLQVEYGNF